MLNGRGLLESTNETTVRAGISKSGASSAAESRGSQLWITTAYVCVKQWEWLFLRIMVSLSTYKVNAALFLGAHAVHLFILIIYLLQ